jgi:predicted PurR-regulated permease PerM
MVNQRFWIIAACVLALGLIIRSLTPILLPFIVGFIGAYALNAPVSFFERLKLSRALGSAFIILSLLSLLILIVVVALPYLQQQIFYFAQAVPRLAEEAFQIILPLLQRSSEELGTPAPTELKAQLSTHLGDLFSWTISFFTNLLTNSMAIANILSLVILSPIVTFYLLKDWPKILHKLDVLLPHRYAPLIRDNARTIDKTLSSYAKGQTIVCLILMILYASSLWFIGLNQGVFVGMLTGFLSFIPYVGMIIGLLTSLGIALTQFIGWEFVVKVLLTFMIIGLIEGNFLTPRFIGERIGLHPVWIIFSLLAGGTWFGFIGVIFALPVAAMIGVIARLLMKWYLSTSFYKNEPQVP